MQSKTIQLQVKDPETRERLDIFLSHKFDRVSRSIIKKWIGSGFVTVDGKPCKSKYLLKPGQTVDVNPPDPEPVKLVAEAIPLEIVYEDDILIVVNKPAGMVVHPGAGNRRGTLANALVHHFGQMAHSDTLRPGIVHRLDKETSGLLVVAKNDHVHEQLSRQFKERRVRKIYRVLVYGHMKKRRGVVDVSLGRDPRVRTKISTRSHRLRQALTEYEVLHYYSDFTYVKAYLHTGRTHQIRVHFQYLGHPVVGDKTYGFRLIHRLDSASLAAKVRNLSRHFLHASSLSFTHPGTQKEVLFQTSLPSDLDEFLSGLG